MQTFQIASHVKKRTNEVKSVNCEEKEGGRQSAVWWQILFDAERGSMKSGLRKAWAGKEPGQSIHGPTSSFDG